MRKLKRSQCTHARLTVCANISTSITFEYRWWIRWILFHFIQTSERDREEKRTMLVFLLSYRSNGFPSSLQYCINRILRRVPYTQLVHRNVRSVCRISQVWFMDAPHSITWPIQSRSHMLQRDHGHRSETAAAAVVYWLSLSFSVSPQKIVQPPRPNEYTIPRAERSPFQFNSKHWHLFGFEFYSEQCTSLIIISKKKIYLKNHA